jgi:hypothetical protein
MPFFLCVTRGRRIRKRNASQRVWPPNVDRAKQLEESCELLPQRSQASVFSEVLGFGAAENRVLAFVLASALTFAFAFAFALTRTSLIVPAVRDEVAAKSEVVVEDAASNFLQSAFRTVT